MTGRGFLWLVTLSLFWTICRHYCHGDELHIGNTTLTRRAAAVTCSQLPGGRLANANLLSRDQLQHIGTWLQDGESAWLGDIADMSDFTVYIDCIPIALLGRASHVIRNNNFYRCSRACDDQTRYVGLQKDNCYCFKAYPDVTVIVSGSPPSCDAMCNSTFGESCGDVTDAAIYEISREADIGFGSVGRGFDQCVLLSQNESVSAYTAPCEPSCPSCAYICKVEGTTRCQFLDVCILYGSRKYSWREASDQCTTRYNGILYNASQSTHSKLSRYLIDSFGFWTGYFRTFEISLQKASPLRSDSCVAIRNARNALRYEATNCSDQKPYICSFLGGPIPGPVTGAGDGTGFPVWIIVVIVLGVVLLIVLVLCIICIVTRRRRSYKGDYRDSSMASSSGSIIRYGLDEKELDRIATRPLDSPRLGFRPASPGETDRNATLIIGQTYKSEWRGIVTESPRTSRPGTPRLERAAHDNPTFAHPSDTDDTIDLDHEVTIVTKESREIHHSNNPDWLIYSGHPSERGPDGSPTRKAEQKCDNAVPDAANDADDVYSMPNKTGDKSTPYVQRPIRTYLDHMYEHLKRNIENNQANV